MNRLACLLTLVLVVCLSASAAQLVLGQARGARTILDLPITVTTGDGVELEKGQYLVVVQEPLLRQVASPGSLGFWPGPVVHLRPAEDALKPNSFYTLKTAFEVRLVHPVPRAAPRPQQVQESETRVTPYIRDGQLVGIFYQGRILFITEASSRLRLHYRYFPLFRP